MTPRRSPKLYARPRASIYLWVHGRCSHKRRTPSPYSLRPPGCCNPVGYMPRADRFPTNRDFPVSQKLDFMTFLRPGGDAYLD